MYLHKCRKVSMNGMFGWNRVRLFPSLVGVGPSLVIWWSSEKVWMQINCPAAVNNQLTGGAALHRCDRRGPQITVYFMHAFAFNVNLKAFFGEVVETWTSLFLCVCAASANMRAPVFQMNTVTSALLSGVVILGVMSVCFFIFSLTLLKGKGPPVSTLSGARNPAFNWVNDVLSNG